MQWFCSGSHGGRSDDSERKGPNDSTFSNIKPRKLPILKCALLFEDIVSPSEDNPPLTIIGNSIQ